MESWALLKNIVLDTNMVFASVNLLQKLTTSILQRLSGGKHLGQVAKSQQTCIVPVDELEEMLVYICTDVSDNMYVLRLPNRHGHSVFK